MRRSPLFVRLSASQRMARRTRRWLTPVAAAAAFISSAPAIAVDYVWGAGSFSGSGLPTAMSINDTLAIGCWPALCGSKVLDQNLSSSASIVATDHLYFYNNNSLSNQLTYELRGDVGLFDQYGGNALVNTGVLVKSQGAGTSAITINSSHSANALVDAMAGTLNFAAGNHRFDSGATLLAAAGAVLRFGGGTVSFADGVRWFGAGQYTLAANATVQGAIGAQNLRFENASWTGGDGSALSHARLQSDAVWSGNGRLEGVWHTDAGTTLRLQDSGTKYLGDHAVLVNNGSISAGDHLRFWYTSSLVNHGSYAFDGDVSLVETYGSSSVVNHGTLAKVAGAGTSAVSVAFANHGVIDAQTGTIAFNAGANSFNDGTVLKGAGTVLVNSAAEFSGVIQSANLVLSNASWTGGNGTPGSSAVLNGQALWSGAGRLEGRWRTSPGTQMTLSGAGAKYLGDHAAWTNQGTVLAGDHLRLWYSSQLINQGTWQLQGDVGLLETYGSSLVSNLGTLVKTTGSGTAPITVSLSGGALSQIVVQQGDLDFQAGSHSFVGGAAFLAGAGTGIRFTGGSAAFADGVAFNGAGQYTFATDASFAGSVAAQNLLFRNASWTGGNGSPGSHATLASDASWSGAGRLEGAWQIQAGRKLTLVDAGAKYLGDHASLNVQGTLDAYDPLRLWYSSRLDNAGSLRLNGDVGLYDTYGASQVSNTGLLSKVSGSGVSQVAVAFVNSGTVEAKTGTLEFSAGASTFNPGTRFTGAGQVLVDSAARFNGAFLAQNLVLANATWTGANAVLSGRAQIKGAGRLEGQWRVDAGAQLTLADAGAKYLGDHAQLVNDGNVTAADPLRLWYYSSVVNNGTWRLAGDVGLLETYGGSAFVNNGLLVKTAGSGESTINVGLDNTGTIEVQTGTLRLPDNFSNAGTLQGVGRFAVAGSLSNTGHIAPGASPGSLTLDTQLVLGSAGTLDIELHNLAQHDLLRVNGNVILGGGLTLACYGACNLAAGSDILILDGSGSLSGSFERVSLTGFQSGAFDLVYDTANADVWLHVTQSAVAAVPEPQTWALWMLGLGALAGLARRRSNAV